MLCEVMPQLNIELNGNCDRSRLKNFNPDMGILRVQRGLAIASSSLGDDRDDCEEYSNEAVLEDCNIDNL